MPLHLPDSFSEPADDMHSPAYARRTHGWNDVRWLLPFIRPHWCGGAVAVAVAVMSTAAALVLPLTFKALTDGALLVADQARLNRVLGTMTAVLLFIAAADFVKQLYFVRFQQRVILGVQRHLLHRVLRLPKEFFDANRTGYLMSRVISDVFELQTFFSLSLVSIVTKTIQLVAVLVILLSMNWRLTTLAVMVVPLYVVVTRAFGARLRRLQQAAMESSAIVSEELEETLAASTLIKSFATEARESDRVSDSLRRAFEASFRRTVTGGIFGLLSAAINAVGMGAVLWYGASQVVARRMTLGELVAFSAYLGFLIEPARFLAGFSITLQQAFAALDRVLELLRLMPEDDHDDSKLRVAALRGTITFERVSFSYDGKRQTLTGVSFEAGPQQVIGIVGPSGAGKSTLASLITCLYDPGGGTISFDGVPSTHLNRQSVRQRIGVVSQETVLLDDSVRNNIRYGNPQTSDTDVERAARAAGAHDFIAALSGGYEARVGDRGVKLSVGQKQRISIARALLKDPDIFVFDEPTSALDALTERIVQQLLTDLRATRTVFVIAHRLSTVLLCDSILVLDGGRIVQRGTHDELWHEGGLYRHLCQTELGRAPATEHRPDSEQAASLSIANPAVRACHVIIDGQRVESPPSRSVERQVFGER